MSPKIKDLVVQPLDLPLKEPFIIATGRKDAADNVLVKVVLDDGHIGFGEIAPSPYTTGDMRETAIAVLTQLKRVVVGREIGQWRPILADTRKTVRFQFGAHSALEIALLDAFGKACDMPLYQFYGGAITEVETDLTISLGTPKDSGAAAARAVSEGFRKIKIKVGGSSLENDHARILAIRQATPGCELSLDANQGYSPKDAVELVRRIQSDGADICLLEQPVRRDDLAGMRYVREHCGVPVAADESVVTPEDAIRVVREGAADVINIKIAKAGMLGALEIAGIAKAANLGLMIGCMMESKIGLAGSVHVACGLGGFSHCDLDSIYLLKPFECTGGFNLRGPVFSVEGIGPGTGIQYAG